MLFRTKNKLAKIHRKELQLMRDSDLLTNLCKKMMLSVMHHYTCNSDWSTKNG